jgi:hypothetical protein
MECRQVLVSSQGHGSVKDVTNLKCSIFGEKPAESVPVQSSNRTGAVRPPAAPVRRLPFRVVFLNDDEGYCG